MFAANDRYDFIKCHALLPMQRSQFILLIFLYLLFFFQAEDGIRDSHVTGVQTCALPILLSRIKPSDIEEHRLPGAIPGRGAMVVRYGEGRQAFYLVVLHLALGRRARAQQLEYVADLIKTRPNTVVMGDFNAGPAAHEVLRFCRQADLIQPGESALTFPSWQPQRAIDQILVSPGIRVREIRALPVTFSDHQPLAMTIEFGSGVDLPAQQKSESFREFTEYSQ